MTIRNVLADDYPSIIRCVTSLMNRASIRFHKRIGFEPEQGDSNMVVYLITVIMMVSVSTGYRL